MLRSLGSGAHIRVRSIGALLLLLCCCSCASIYVSGVRNVPLLTRRGEFQGSASFGKGTNITTAYALTDHVGITVGGMYANNRQQNLNNTYRRHQSGEVGLGYFGHTNKISYEIFSGYGAGRGYAQDSVFGFFFFSNVQRTAEGGYHKYFIQPTFAFRPKRFLLAITMRMTYLQFKDIRVMTNNGDPSILRSKYSYVFEPCFTAKYFLTEKPKSMFVFAQAGFGIADQTDEVEYNMPFFMPHYNVGIGFRLSKPDP
ncbi:MAG TPA: hypothetical protein VF141_18555 [Chryseolinea sp.]